MTLRKLFLYLYLVVGLTAAVMLIISAMTDCLLAFEKKIHFALNRKLMRVPPQGERLALAVLTGKLEKADSEKQVPRSPLRRLMMEP